MAYERTPADRLEIPLSKIFPLNDPDTEAFVVDQIISLVDAAEGDVIILVDICALRHDCKEELIELVHRSRFPVYSSPMGKGIVDENYDRYGGASLFCTIHCFG